MGRTRTPRSQSEDRWRCVGLGCPAASSSLPLFIPSPPLRSIRIISSRAVAVSAGEGALVWGARSQRGLWEAMGQSGAVSNSGRCVFAAESLPGMEAALLAVPKNRDFGCLP